jgi:hypothetical protein
MYERSIYLTLFSSPDFIVRDIKSKRTRIPFPRFNMVMLGHPIYFVNSLKSERHTYDDGLFQRIIMNCPTPPDCSAEDMREPTTSDITLTAIMFFIHILHSTKREYTFTSSATIIINKQYNLYKRLVRLANEYDPYLG